MTVLSIDLSTPRAVYTGVYLSGVFSTRKVPCPRRNKIEEAIKVNLTGEKACVVGVVSVMLWIIII